MSDTVNNRAKGTIGERIAAKELYRKGYEILEMNYRGKVSEIDIIAKQKDTIIFVEVKFRYNLNHGLPKEAVDFRKQSQIIKAAKQYISYHKLFDQPIRFDVCEVIELERKKYFNHIENAFWE